MELDPTSRFYNAYGAYDIAGCEEKSVENFAE